jgi:hypothetical protein
MADSVGQKQVHQQAPPDFGRAAAHGRDGMPVCSLHRAELERQTGIFSQRRQMVSRESW